MIRLGRLAEARIAHAHVIEARETALIERMERAEIRCRYPFLFPRLRTAILRVSVTANAAPAVDALATAAAMVRKGVIARSAA